MKATESTAAAAAENIMTDGVEHLTDLDATDERGVSADLVRAYLNGIGRTRLLTAVEEVTGADGTPPESTVAELVDACA